MRSKILMLIALVAIAAGIFGLLLSKSEPTPEIKVAEQIPEIFFKSYVLANGNVTKGGQVNRADFKIVKLSENEANQKGFDQDALFDFEHGSIYRTDLTEGQTVFASDVVQPSQPNYIELTLAKDHVPYPIEVSPSAIVGGVINIGSYVDILALTGHQNPDPESEKQKKKQVSINPVLTNVKVLKISVENIDSGFGQGEIEQNYLILELDRKQVAVLTIAKNISAIEVHKSIGNYSLTELEANAGDVLPDFKAIKELRAEQIVVN
ncbi:Flp pilus assembly protein CpaB [Vibrio scophthalmi]|uniref:Flp pilus assembly protein CpaB n=1 Tax=Vibrio scophthalmi LMG 19158 TaxID=870967 RepID=F9RLX7_9VIBR|nr:Flp pilus assembly protein CpaB [Vibrio scophthalmi]EGU38677.1 Flp pilus assembly protein CpaB [Vibrio scophthalmi LMG 19158]